MFWSPCYPGPSLWHEGVISWHESRRVHRQPMLVGFVSHSDVVYTRWSRPREP